jgi:hypothetical protein
VLLSCGGVSLVLLVSELCLLGFAIMRWETYVWVSLSCWVALLDVGFFFVYLLLCFFIAAGVPFALGFI